MLETGVVGFQTSINEKTEPFTALSIDTTVIDDVKEVR
jgi:hypothetical protein